MTAYTRMRLWETCLDKRLFKVELEKLVSNSSRNDILDLHIYCYDKYSDMHAEVLFEVFSKYHEYSSNESPVYTC